MKKIFIVVFVAALTILATGTASADWSQQFSQGTNETYIGTTVGTFDRIGLWWLSGDKFADPGISGLSVSGWTGDSFLNNTFAGTIGPAITNGTLYLTLNFQGTGTTEFLWGTANGSDIRQRQHFSYNGSWSSYDVTPEQWETYNLSTVPEPVSTVLFLLGGATLAVRRVYKSKKS